MLFDADFPPQRNLKRIPLLSHFTTSDVQAQCRSTYALVVVAFTHFVVDTIVLGIFVHADRKE
jgi:hypothetical protein